ncbi:YceD family protein [Aliiroseovarius sp. S253]|uniref:YceD family protein n=1 Tax=Aliiroseovarius sp. S253 TaxID=3415133 RepID=UPI003C7E1871
MSTDTPGTGQHTTKYQHILRVADLSTGSATPFELIPTDAECKAIAAELGIPALRKLRFKGTLNARGKTDWQLKAQLGATVVQDCVVTLDPVTTRIEDPVSRRWVRDLPELEAGDEIEMPDDETLEQLGAEIDLGEVMIESLALALPMFPRAEGAELDQTNFAAPGVAPMSDEDARPFAGLSALRDQLAGKSDSSDDAE